MEHSESGARGVSPSIAGARTDFGRSECSTICVRGGHLLGVPTTSLREATLDVSRRGATVAALARSAHLRRPAQSGDERQLGAGAPSLWWVASSAGTRPAVGDGERSACLAPSKLGAGAGAATIGIRRADTHHDPLVGGHRELPVSCVQANDAEHPGARRPGAHQMHADRLSVKSAVDDDVASRRREKSRQHAADRGLGDCAGEAVSVWSRARPALQHCRRDASTAFELQRGSWWRRGHPVPRARQRDRWLRLCGAVSSRDQQCGHGSGNREA